MFLSLCLPGARGALPERGFFALCQGLLGIQETVDLDELRHDPGPTGLMAGAQPGAVVAVEVFVKEDEILPVGVLLELFRPPVNGPPAGRP